MRCMIWLNFYEMWKFDNKNNFFPIWVILINLNKQEKVQIFKKNGQYWSKNKFFKHNFGLICIKSWAQTW